MLSAPVVSFSCGLSRPFAADRYISKVPHEEAVIHRFEALALGDDAAKDAAEASDGGPSRD